MCLVICTQRVRGPSGYTRVARGPSEGVEGRASRSATGARIASRTPSRGLRLRRCACRGPSAPSCALLPALLPVLLDLLPPQQDSARSLHYFELLQALLATAASEAATCP